MEVKEFVKSILKDVMEAIDESNSDKMGFYIKEAQPGDGIDFDLAIVLKKGAEGKIGAQIFSVVSAKAQGNMSEETVNRIKFNVKAWKK